MRLYTRTGDEGKTSLIGGRVDKDDIRVEAYGTVDEANSFIGLLMSELDKEIFSDVLLILEKIQQEMLDCAGDLANVTKRRQFRLTDDATLYLENRIDEMIEETSKIDKFILPGGAKPSAICHVARTVTRRAERRAITLNKQEENISQPVLRYLNRLSDYLFALARVINYRLQAPEVLYERSGHVFRAGHRKGDGR